MKLLDVQHPFFIPLWRRIATVAACIGWAGVEFWQGAPFWGIIFLAAGLFAGWQLFFNRKPD